MTGLYPSSCGDYYPKEWDILKYQEQLDIILNRSETGFLAVQNHAFSYLGLIGRICQVVKGLFGFGNATNSTLVHSELMKFLYYGEVRGWIDVDQISKLKYRVSNSKQFADEKIHSLAQKIILHSQEQDKTAKAEHQKCMQMCIIEYHREHASDLRPPLWHRSEKKATLKADHLVHFGDTPLQLAQKALESSQPEFALRHLLEAHALHNTSPEFQRKLGQELKTFLSQYKTENVVFLQKKHIQECLLSLASTAYENQQTTEAKDYLSYLQQQDSSTDIKTRIGKVYLRYDQQNDVLSYLDLLEKACAADPEVLVKIAQSYLYHQNFAKVIEAYQGAITNYKEKLQKAFRTQSFYQNQLANLHAEMGKLYLQGKLTGSDIYAKAIYHFSEVCKNRNDESNELNLFKAFYKQWKSDSNGFETMYGEQWLKLLNRSSAILKPNQTEIKQILRTCIEQKLANRNERQAQKYVDQGLQIFKQDQDLICEILDLCLKHQAFNPLKGYVSQWKTLFPSNPLLFDKIGQLYLLEDKKAAMLHYKEAISLYVSKQKTSSSEAEKQFCKERIAALNYHIANDLLEQPLGFFQSTSARFDLVISHLEQAVQNDSTKEEYALLLGQKCIQAGKTEKDKNFLIQDTNKVISYYKMAYQYLPKNGPYLTDLFNLYIEKDRCKEAALLYEEIKAKPWSSELLLTAKIYSKLAWELYNQSPKKHSLIADTLEKACQLDPKESDYQENFCQFMHSWACEKLKQFEQLTNEESKISLFQEVIGDLTRGSLNRLDKVSTELKNGYFKTFAKVYKGLANIYLQRVDLEKPITIARERAKYFRTHQSTIKQVLDYYEQALRYADKDSSIHFEKALLLEHAVTHIEVEEALNQALEAYKLAVKYNKNNPFYIKSLKLLYHFQEIEGLTQKWTEDDRKLKKKYETAFPESKEFDQDFWAWTEKCFCKNQTINPHSYQIKKK